PDIGTVVLTDSKTGEQLRVNTGDQCFRERFAQAARRREESLNATFARAGVDVLVLRTDEDLVRAIVRFAYWRKRRAGRRAPMGSRRRWSRCRARRARSFWPSMSRDRRSPRT